MSVIEAATPTWTAKRTEETTAVERLLRDAGFERADAYRYNPASIRVRVVDRRFAGLPVAERDALVEPYLQRLPEPIQADIVMLLTFAPGEIETPSPRRREWHQNAEFEEPDPPAE